MDWLVGILESSLYLFVEMSPYLMLGLFFVGILNVLITKNMVTKHLGKNNFTSILKGSLFGIPLPLCSCGVIPTAVFMKQNNASKSSVTSFLISTPQTGVDSIAATYGMMGPIFAIFRPVAALLMGLAGGLAVKFLDKPEPKKFISLNVVESKTELKEDKQFYNKFIKYPYRDFLDDIAPQFIVGLLIAGVIAFAFPESFFKNIIFENSILAMLIMIVAGVPMYICATASIPIAVAMMAKGLSPGAAFVFLAVGPATNAASFSILSKSLGKKVTSIYIASIAISSIILGLLFDYFIVSSELNIMAMIPKSSLHEHHEGFSFFTLAMATILAILLLYSLYNIYFVPLFTFKEKVRKSSEDAVILKVEGMTCTHCENTVKDALKKNGTTIYSINHKSGTIQISKSDNLEFASKAIEEVGYKVKGKI